MTHAIANTAFTRLSRALKKDYSSAAVAFAHNANAANYNRLTLAALAHQQAQWLTSTFVVGDDVRDRIAKTVFLMARDDWSRMTVALAKEITA